MQKPQRSKSAVLAGLLASLGWGVDIGTGKQVATTSSPYFTAANRRRAKKNGDGKRIKRGASPDKMQFCLAKRKGISGVPKGYQDNRGMAVGFNVNGFRGAGLR